MIATIPWAVGTVAPAILIATFLLAAVAVLAASTYEGFGARTVGGEGPKDPQVFWVDPELGDCDADQHGVGTQEHPCGLRKALADGDRIIKFTRPGTITLNASIYLQHSCVTIDGASAPEPGITITHTQANHGGLIIGSPGKDIHDFIISHIRFEGLWDRCQQHVSGWNMLGVYCDDRTGGSASNVVFDHLTVRYLQDKISFWGAVRNVTVSNCLFYDSHMATLVSFYGHPYDLLRKGITFHHNVYARSTQRNPQLRGWIEDFEYINNIVYGWNEYGMRIKNQPGEKSINANVLNNLFVPGEKRRDSALIYGWDPGPDYADGGPDEDLPQGTVYTDSDMGKLYVAGNILPPENRDQYSTIRQPLEIPNWAKITTCDAKDLPDTLLGEVGMMYRDEREDVLLAEVARAAAAACT